MTLIYKCSFAVAHFVLQQCFKMSDVYVEINMNEKKKGVKLLKSLTVNNGTLAMIFRLVLNHEIYTSRTLRKRA